MRTAARRAHCFSLGGFGSIGLASRDRITLDSLTTYQVTPRKPLTNRYLQRRDALAAPSWCGRRREFPYRTGVRTPRIDP